MSEFQSTPLSIERSDRQHALLCRCQRRVSIHAPLHREERLSVGWDGSKHVAGTILSTEGNVIHPTHFLDVILPPEVM